MTSREKYQKMLSLEPYNDRSEIPVFPFMVATYSTMGDVVLKDLITVPDKWIEAMDNTYSKIGVPDVGLNAFPGDIIFSMSLPARLPGRDLPDNELYQFVETPYFNDANEYYRILEMGWSNWYGEYLMKIQNPQLTNPAQLGQKYQNMGINMAKGGAYIAQKGMISWADYFTSPIFDNLSLIRSMAEFTCDIFENPGPIMDIIRKYQPLEVEKNIQMLKQIGGNRICIFNSRSSATFISPSMFEEYIWPDLKASVEAYWKAGITSIFHADGNWLPFLKYFTELPKGCCHFELDGATDIEAAYEILRGSQSIDGDVPSTLFAFGTPDQVSEYCEKLIKMGMKGGFMLASGCEIPLNAKIECVKAMMESIGK